jgi:hypothetical protein
MKTSVLLVARVALLWFIQTPEEAKASNKTAVQPEMRRSSRHLTELLRESGEEDR